MHPSPERTAHPRTSHRTLPRRSISTHRPHTPNTRMPTPRILRARLPLPTPTLPISRSRSSSPSHYNTYNPQAHLRPLDRHARFPTNAARRQASRVFFQAGRVSASLHNRYASRQHTGMPAPCLSDHLQARKPMLSWWGLSFELHHFASTNSSLGLICCTVPNRCVA